MGRSSYGAVQLTDIEPPASLAVAFSEAMPLEE
jgi:hypothetical protein